MNISEREKVYKREKKNKKATTIEIINKMKSNKEVLLKIERDLLKEKKTSKEKR